MVAEIRAEHESEWAAMTKVAELLGVGTPETIRKWCRQAEVDAGQRPGTTTEESAELKTRACREFRHLLGPPGHSGTWRPIPGGRREGGPNGARRNATRPIHHSIA